MRSSIAGTGSTRSDWIFDTIRSSAVMGTYRSMAKDLLSSPGSIPDENDEDDDSHEGGQGSIDTGAATKGSDPLTSSALGMNAEASHSTIIIKPLPPRSRDGRDSPPMMDTDEFSSPSEGSDPVTPDDATALENIGAPPAYSNSIRTKRASYAARNVTHGAGTVLSYADLGNGVDTIRPIKKVDAAGSLRLSADFVGSVRKEGSGSSSPVSPVKEAHRRAASEAARAGRSLVDDVILPLLQGVSRALFGYVCS
jgi:serine/threonine-protein kinase 24/25/MST4